MAAVPGQAYCRTCKADVQREYRRSRSKGPRWETWEDRLLARLEWLDDHLLATHGRDAAGYPQIYLAGRQRRVHVVFWEMQNGPVPPGLELDHTCEVFGKQCVSHLEPVTHAENIRRGYARRHLRAPASRPQRPYR